MLKSSVAVSLGKLWRYFRIPGNRYHVDSLFCVMGTGQDLAVTKLERDDIRNSIYEFAAQVKAHFTIKNSFFD